MYILLTTSTQDVVLCSLLHIHLILIQLKRVFIWYAHGLLLLKSFSSLSTVKSDLQRCCEELEDSDTPITDLHDAVWQVTGTQAQGWVKDSGFILNNN